VFGEGGAKETRLDTKMMVNRKKEKDRGCQRHTKKGGKGQHHETCDFVEVSLGMRFSSAS